MSRPRLQPTKTAAESPQTNVYLGDDLHNWVEQRAIIEKTSKAAIIRRALIKFREQEDRNARANRASN